MGCDMYWTLLAVCTFSDYAYKYHYGMQWHVNMLLYMAHGTYNTFCVLTRTCEYTSTSALKRLPPSQAKKPQEIAAVESKGHISRSASLNTSSKPFPWTSSFERLMVIPHTRSLYIPGQKNAHACPPCGAPWLYSIYVWSQICLIVR